MVSVQGNNAVESAVIDETFRNVVDPVVIHRMGREDIVENRPGDVLVEEVKAHAARGGFAREQSPAIDDGVKVSQAKEGRLDLEAARELAAGIDSEASANEIKD